ncbi:DUF2092 domain-containing protein [Thioalkalicoccus limnaeus]|uniref:DUF2092 domain-containing protein n=1 Tax=Thioalkalicoccus limnaeus TaxID=120681 RepID=A0ABV4BE66_9GAMM
MMSFLGMSRVGALWLAALTLATLPVAAPWAADQPQNDEAMDHLMRMARHLSELERVSVVLRAGYDVVQESGQKIEFTERRAILLMRPDQLRVDAETSDGERSVLVFDDGTLTLMNATDKTYASSAIPGTVDAAITHFVRDQRMRLPLAMLFVTGLPTELERRLTEAQIVETTLIGGVSHRHIAARGATVDVQVWLPETGDPFPQRIILTYKQEAGQPQFWANFLCWDSSPEPPASAFSLEIPADATRIAFLTQVRAAQSGAPEQGETP